MAMYGFEKYRTMPSKLANNFAELKSQNFLKLCKKWLCKFSLTIDKYGNMSPKSAKQYYLDNF